MIDIDKWGEIYQTVKKHKLRTALTAFGVFWGIFMLIVLLGAGKGFENGVVQSFDVAKNAVFLWSQRTSKEYKGLKVGRFIRLTNDDVKAIRDNVPEAAIISPRLFLDGNFFVQRGLKTSSFQVFGDYPTLLQVEPQLVSMGRFLNDIDIKEKRKTAIIGEKVRETLFKPDENPIGQYIKIKGVFFKVVGVFTTRQKGEDARQATQTIYVPLTTMQSSFNMPNRIGWMGLVPKPGIPAKIVEDKAKSLLMVRHNVSPEDTKAFGSANVEEEYKKIQGLFLGIGGFSWLVSIGTILAGIIGVSNIMLIVVKERTKEIGIRKALGATPYSIISLIIQESIVITAAAGFIGLGLGTALIETINYLLKKFEAEGQFFANPEVNINVALTAFVLLVISGAFAGLIPATKAAQVSPVVALKDE